MNIAPLNMNNQTAFGIKMTNPAKFSRNLTKSIETSPLVKSIDTKYPEASVFMKSNGKSNFLEFSLGNGYRFSLSGSSVEQQLKTGNLKEIESMIYNSL